MLPLHRVATQLHIPYWSILIDNSFYCSTNHFIVLSLICTDFAVICCFIYVKKSWLLNVNTPLGTWFGKQIILYSYMSLKYLFLNKIPHSIPKINHTHSCVTELVIPKTICFWNLNNNEDFDNIFSSNSSI